MDVTFAMVPLERCTMFPMFLRKSYSFAQAATIQSTQRATMGGFTIRNWSQT